MKPQWIVCAATRMGFQFEDTYETRVFTSPRHWDPTMHQLIQIVDDAYLEHKIDEVQGFVDQWGDFLTREQAWLIAKENGQIKHRCGGDEYIYNGETIGRLFSENLY